MARRVESEIVEYNEGDDRPQLKGAAEVNPSKSTTASEPLPTTHKELRSLIRNASVRTIVLCTICLTLGVAIQAFFLSSKNTSPSARIEKHRVSQRPTTETHRQRRARWHKKRYARHHHRHQRHRRVSRRVALARRVIQPVHTKRQISHAPPVYVAPSYSSIPSSSSAGDDEFGVDGSR